MFYYYSQFSVHEKLFNLLDNHTLRYTMSLFIALYFSAYETQSLHIATNFFDMCDYAYFLHITSLVFFTYASILYHFSTNTRTIILKGFLNATNPTTAAKYLLINILVLISLVVIRHSVLPFLEFITSLLHTLALAILLYFHSYILYLLPNVYIFTY